MKKKLSTLLIFILICSLLTACSGSGGTGEETKNYPAAQMSQPKIGDLVVTISTTKGDIKAVLFKGETPLNVTNFVALATSGFYDGMVIHKVIADYCIQMGDPTLKGDGGTSSTGFGIEQEYSDSLHNFVGALAMVPGADGLNNSQFYIVAGSEMNDEYVTALKEGRYPSDVISTYEQAGGLPSLDYVYTVFGQVYQGLDIVKTISNVKTDKYNRPDKDIKIKSITVSTYGE